MNLEQILMAIQFNIDQSNDPIEWQDEDTIVRMGLIDRSIRRWGGDNTTRWDELYDNDLLSEPISEGINEYDLPNNYYMLDAVYDERGQGLEVKNIRDAVKVGKYVFISGNRRDGFKLRLGWKPTADDKLLGQTLRVLQYRTPVLLENPEDVPEMDQPEYIVANVSAELMISDDTTQYGKYANDAGILLANMRQRQDQLAQHQHSNALEDDERGLGE